MRTLREEALGFRFDYPLEVDAEAGPPNSLHYYLYSDRLTWGAMRMDAAGVPKVWYRLTGATYRPAYVAWYALVNLGHYLRGKGSRHLEVFLSQIDWLESNAVLRDDGAVVWPQPFDYSEGGIHLRAPWVSANAQGMAMSAMVRGLRVTKKRSLRELLVRSAKIFDLEVAQGGVRSPVDGGAFYTEVPGGPVPGILDGFMTSLLGLYDLWIETEDAKVGKMFREGLDGLKHLLPAWDYRQKWSWYGCRAYLSPPAYQCLNRLQLSVLARLSGEASLAEYADRWNPANLSAFERGEIYLMFLLTKNAFRFRRRTWLHTQRKPQPAMEISGEPSPHSDAFAPDTRSPA
jgi:D-glucuronyl C5-epimerase-like protein